MEMEEEEGVFNSTVALDTIEGDAIAEQVVTNHIYYRDYSRQH